MSRNSGGVLNRASREKSVLLVNNGRWFTEHNGNGIETHLAPNYSRTRCIAACRTHDAVLLLAVNGALRAAELSRCPGLHFDENQRAIVASHNVHFRVPATWAVVPRHDSETRVSKIPMRQILASPP